MQRSPNDDPRTLLSSISVRELDCLRLRCEGLTNGGVAQALSIKYGTVKNHISSVLQALGKQSIDEACYELGRCDERRLQVDGRPIESRASKLGFPPA